MLKSKAHTLAYLGVMFALVFVFLAIETIVFEPLFGFVPPAILTIPLAIALSLSGTRRPYLVGGTLLGFSSFVLAIMISNVIFLNPLISILPRIFIGVGAYFVFKGVTSLTKNAKSKFVREILPCSIAGIVGTITNTVLVIFMMWVFTYSTLATVFTTILSINFLFEVVGSMILVPIYVRVIQNVTK